MFWVSFGLLGNNTQQTRWLPSVWDSGGSTLSLFWLYERNLPVCTTKILISDTCTWNLILSVTAHDERPCLVSVWCHAVIHHGICGVIQSSLVTCMPSSSQVSYTVIHGDIMSCTRPQGLHLVCSYAWWHAWMLCWSVARQLHLARGRKWHSSYGKCRSLEVF